MTSQPGPATQKTVPISAAYHDELRAIAFMNHKSMKGVIEDWIKADGRGKKFLDEMKGVGVTETILEKQEPAQPGP